ncbi:MAG: hypothetical protein ACI85I_001617 [Arenicella sp.]|jgi:hypothetical protein
MATWVRSQKVLFSSLENELIMMDVDGGYYHGTNEVGKRIWELLEHTTTLDTICKQLLEEYDISEEECKKYTQQFLDDLDKKGLVVSAS